MRNVFDKSFLETVREKSTYSMFNNGQSKHRLVTFKEETFADSFDYITLKTVLVDKYGT